MSIDNLKSLVIDVVVLPVFDITFIIIVVVFVIVVAAVVELKISNSDTNWLQ